MKTGVEMQEKIRVGVIGAGCSGTGQLLMMEKFEPGCAVAFCDIDRTIFDKIISGYLGDESQSWAGDFKTENSGMIRRIKDLPYYKDPEEMLEKEDINTVVISTPDNLHYQMVQKCVKHNVNILLEKPIAIKPDEVEKTWEILRDYPKVVSVNFTMRPAPVSVAARDHVRRGTIGDIVSVQYVNNVHYGDNYFRKWMRTEEKVGSLLLQKATHDFDIINSIIGLKPLSIAAFGSRKVYGGDMPDDLTCDNCNRKWTCPMSIYRLKQDKAKAFPPPHIRQCVYASEIDIDDNQVVIIRYENGVTASYSQTFNAPQEAGKRGGNFIGTGGMMRLEYYGQFVENPKGETIFGKSRIDIHRYRHKPGSVITEWYDWAGQGHFDGTEYGIEAKIALLKGGKSDVSGTIKEGYISAKMCLAAQESIKTGRVITLDLKGV